MSLRRVKGLARAWKQLGIFEAAEAVLDDLGFTDSYVDYVSAFSSSPKTKVVKDAIWGMIEIDPSCLKIIDTPILQHMREIRQTGLTYLTYPPAEHTRFVHSIGMLHVVSRFLDTTSKRHVSGASFENWPVNETWRSLLKHAALLHDIGHLPFSHVTERIVEDDPDIFTCGKASVSDFLFQAEQHLKRPKPVHFAECLSLAIILTPRFRRFYSRYVAPASSADHIYKIGAMIMGLAPEEHMPGLAEIISSSSIDADKIDYINRDASACGIPIGVDISRLFIHSAFIKVEPAELKRLKKLDAAPAHSEIIFVVNSSGLDSIEEIGQARTALYHRVYLHQTTRNAERLLSKALFMAAENTSKRAKHSLKNALRLWLLDDFALLTRLSEIGRTKRLASKILNRQLPKRACIFGRNYIRTSMPFDSVFNLMPPKSRTHILKQISGTALDSFKRNDLRGKKQRSIEDRISKEIRKVAAAISQGDGEVPTGSPTVVVVLPMSNLEQDRSDSIVLQNTRLASAGGSSIADEQMEAADIAKSVGYVMTDVEWREIAFVAARTIFYDSRGTPSDLGLTPYAGAQEVPIRCLPNTLLDFDAVVEKIGLDQNRLDDVMSAADAGGYFTGRERLLPYNQEYSNLSAAANHLEGFAGEGNWRVTADSVKAFLEQFPSCHRQKVLELILGFEILDKAKLVSSLKKNVLAIDKAQKGFVVGLSPDSGNTARIYVENELRTALKKDAWFVCKSVRDVLREAQAGDDIVFCDDNITSGSQALAQFMTWFGCPDAMWTDDQKLETGIEKTPLSKNEKDLLEKLNVTIVTAVGSTRANENLANNLPKVGVKNYRGLHYENEIKSYNSNLGDLKPLLEEIGRNVLAWSRHGTTKLSKLKASQREKCKNDALGYDNAMALMCTPMNVPVGTLTAFWCPGIIDGEPWIPLLIRRGYLKNLIIT